MSRLASTLLLALLLVGAQQGALVHGIEHGLRTGFAAGAPLDAKSPRARPLASRLDGAPDSSYCEKCFQFAHVCAAGLQATPGVTLAAPSAEVVGLAEAAELPAEAPVSRSRGPPVIL